MSQLKQSFIYTATSLILLLCIQNLHAQETSLQFDDEGEFKIAQFTDMHFYDGGPQSPQVIENIRAGAGKGETQPGHSHR